MTTVLVSKPTDAGFVFSLERSRLLARPIRLLVAEWSEASAAGALPGVSQLLAWVDEDVATATEETITVPFKAIAELPTSRAKALSLTQDVPYLLDVKHVGIISDAAFRFQASWLQPNGQPVLGARQIGCALFVGNSHFRIPEPLFSILAACQEFNDAAVHYDLDARFRIWARMTQLFPADTDRSVRLGSYLNSTRIAHAVSFSLALHSGSNGFTFDPILFGPSAKEADADNPKDLETEASGLLPPQQHSVFAKGRFQESQECRAHYALGDGWYVVLDEPVRQALTVVRRAQGADAETRKQFVRNPRSFLAKALAESVSEPDLDALFVETAEYSGRVRDVGLWQPKVVPWIKKPAEPWIPPETFGVRIGDRIVRLEAREVSDLRAKISAAIEKQEPTVEWKGQVIPASPDTMAAIDVLVGEVSPDRARTGSESNNTEAAPPEGNDKHGARSRYVLEIFDHFSEVEYRPGRLKRNVVPDFGLPAALKTSLKEHQTEGLDWLQQSWARGLRGVLLADDMGLGKTLQALTFLAWLRQSMKAGTVRKAPILIVAPTGLLKNWEQEHAQHLHRPGLGGAVRAFGSHLAAFRTGAGRETELGEATLDADQLSHSDWILTTYETLRDYQHSFCSIRYGAVVFDEMQKVKTPGIAMTDSAKALNADFIIGLTGTPVENRLADLWCLVDTLEPGLLGDLSDFSRAYEREENLEELKVLKSKLIDASPEAPQLMLRRMKADKLPGLPPKIEHHLRETMTGEQAALYEEAILAARKGGGGSKMLQTLQSLRSISLHPFHPDTAKNDNYAQLSARFRVTLGVLDKVAASGEKALIFVESLEMQPYLAAFLQRKYRLSSLPMLISGTVTGEKRQERVNQFQNGRGGFDVIILSPRAGGVGITLTAANHVIHLSRWWNPAIEDQCTDRVYRIGQKAREVHVYYPMAIHPTYGDQSFDQRLDALLNRRRNLSRDLLLPPVDPNDAKDLFEETVGGGQKRVDLNSIDSMEPLQFERWLLSELSAVGHRVDGTRRTGDGGADGVVHHRVSGRMILLQIKHTQRNSSPDEAIADLIRAKNAYSGASGSVRLVAITNARAFGRAAAESARGAGIILVCRDQLLSWPECLPH